MFMDSTRQSAMASGDQPFRSQPFANHNVAYRTTSHQNRASNPVSSNSASPDMKSDPTRTTLRAALAGTGQICFSENWAPSLSPAVAIDPGASTGRSANAALLESAAHRFAQPVTLEGRNLLSSRKRLRQEPQLWEGVALGIVWLCGLGAIVISFAGL